MDTETFHTTSMYQSSLLLCEEPLENCKQDPTELFSRIVTGDETWIHHCDPLSQQQPKVWKKPFEKTRTRLPVTRSAGKIIMTVLWDCKGVLLVDFLSHSTTITGPYYALLLHRLHSSIREKLTVWCATSSRQRTCSQVQHRTSFTELNNSAYSPDLAASDYHLFSNLKNFLGVRNFDSDNDHESLFEES